MKKMISLLLCLCMVFSLAVPAFAAEEDPAPAAENPASGEISGETDTLLTEEDIAAPADTGATGDNTDNNAADPGATGDDTDDNAADPEATGDDTDSNDDDPGEGEPAPDHGDITDTIQWAVVDGELSITGTGKMPDYADGSEAPWAGLDTAAILRVTVGEGITHVGAYAFHACGSMETLALPSTIETLGAYNFNATSLISVDVSERGGRQFMGWCTPDDEDILNNMDLLTVTTAVTAQWYGFYDVLRDDWFYEYVMDCYDGGAMNGIGDGNFDPDGGATRAEVVTVLYRLTGEPSDGSGTSFSDVAEDDWFAEAVIWAADTGIAKGYDDGNFHPYAYVTREEFLVFLDRFAASQELRLCNWSEDYDLSELGIRDSESISSWARESETWSYLIGLQTGYDNGDDTRSLYPRTTITRAELATFLSRFNGNLLLFVYAECSQYLIGQTIATAVAALKTEPDEKLELGNDRFAWCFYDEGVALIVDYGTDSRGIVVDWTYVV